MVIVKSIRHKKQTSIMTIEHNYYANNKSNVNEINAVYALLGGYNEVARHVNYEDFKKIREDFETCVLDLKCLLENN